MTRKIHQICSLMLFIVLHQKFVGVFYFFYWQLIASCGRSTEKTQRTRSAHKKDADQR